MKSRELGSSSLYRQRPEGMLVVQRHDTMLWKLYLQ